MNNQKIPPTASALLGQVLSYEAGYGHKEIGAELKVPGAKAQTYGVIITFIVH